MNSIKTQVRSPWQNCYIERFNLSIKSELLNRVTITDINHARELCSSYMGWYNKKRPHQGIDGRIPAQNKMPEIIKADLNKLNIKKVSHLNGLATHFSIAA